MKASTTTSRTAFLMALAASAPAMAAPGRLAKRDTWTNPEGGGNVFVEVGDNLIQYGSALPSDTLNVIIDKCGELACKPGDPLTVDTNVAGNILGRRTQLLLSVEGSFARTGEAGDKGHLVAMAKEVMYKMYDEGKHTLEENVQWFERPCVDNKNGCTYRDPQYDDQWRATDNVNVRYEDSETGFHAFLNIGYHLVDTSSDGGLCGSLVGVGGAVAGTISSIAAPAGILFSLGSLGCTLGS